MKLDLVFTLIDIPDHPGRLWYREAAAMMIASAQHAFRAHDLRIIQLTDKATPILDGVHEAYAPADATEWSNFCVYRSNIAADWAMHTDRPTILCDVDLLWNNDSIVELMRDRYEDEVYHAIHDITLLHRGGMGVQPFNGGLILTQPRQAVFWATFKEMIRTLPNDIKHWWGDQIALAVMMGAPSPGQKGLRKFNSAVAFIPAQLVAPSPKTQPTALLETTAVHWKGFSKRKAWMAEYYNLLQRNWSAQQAAE